MTSDGNLVAARGGYYAVVKPEEVKLAKTDVSSMLPDGFSKIDGFSIDKTDPTITYFASGGYFVGLKDGQPLGPKTAFPKEMIDAGFTSIDGFSIIGDGVVVFAKDGKFLTLKFGDNAMVEEVVEKATPFPTVLTGNGFTSIDSIDLSMSGEEWYFTATKGSHYIQIKGGAKDPDGTVQGKGKTCLPSVITSNGFNSLDGMSIDHVGTVYVMKGKNVMGVKPGEVITKKTAFPSELIDEGFETIDAFSISGDMAFFAKGSYIIGFQNGKKIMDKTPFPELLTKNGFDTIQGLTVVSGWGWCVAKDGHAMCLNEDSTKVIVQKTKFGPELDGFSAIDGLLMTKDGYVAVAQDGYYTIVKDGTVAVPKTALPSTLTDELCGAVACVGGITVGSAGAPTTVTSAPETYEGGTVPPAPAPGVMAAGPSPAASKVRIVKSCNCLRCAIPPTPWIA